MIRHSWWARVRVAVKRWFARNVIADEQELFICPPRVRMLPHDCEREVITVYGTTPEKMADALTRDHRFRPAPQQDGHEPLFL